MLHAKLNSRRRHGAHQVLVFFLFESTPANSFSENSLGRTSGLYLHPSASSATGTQHPQPLDFESLKQKLEKLMTSGPAVDADKKSAAAAALKDLKGEVR